MAIMEPRIRAIYNAYTDVTMKILIYGLNYSPELTGIGKYSGEMSLWLAQKGHDIRVVTAPPYYPEWQVQAGYKRWRPYRDINDVVTVTRCPLYVPKNPTAIKRILHLSSFALSSLVSLATKIRWKPDVVVLVAPTLFCAPGALLLAKITGATSVIHVQDYEVDAMFGLGIGRTGFIRKVASTIEGRLLRSFDRFSTISTGMLKRAEEKGVPAERLMFFPNWSETERFQNIVRQSELLTRLGVDPLKRVLLYSGNIGEKQGLENVIEAAVRYRAKEDVVFLIVGEGAGKKRLMRLVEEKQLANVKFAPLQPYEDLPALLGSADGHLVIQKRGAADAVLPSKLTNILAVGGNAIITADPHTTLGMLCTEYPGIATLAEPESVDALVAAIETVLDLEPNNLIATNYAAEYLAKDRVLERFLQDVSPTEAPAPSDNDIAVA